MNIFPAIDLFQGKAVRLYKGDYNNMTVYSDDPLSVAKTIRELTRQGYKKSDIEKVASENAKRFFRLK